MAASVIVFVVASVLFFTVGFLCGHFRICQNQKDKNVEETTPSPEKKQTPYYDNIGKFDIWPEHLEKNVAYGPVLQTKI